MTHTIAEIKELKQKLIDWGAPTEQPARDEWWNGLAEDSKELYRQDLQNYNNALEAEPVQEGVVVSDESPVQEGVVVNDETPAHEEADDTPEPANQTATAVAIPIGAPVAALQGNEGKEMASAMTKGVATTTPSIEVGKAQFYVPVGGKMLSFDSLRVIIVAVNPDITKTWYKNSWKPGQKPEAPDCQSNDGIVPHPSIKEPQCATCAACPKNQFGSDGKGKSCKDRRTIAVVAERYPDKHIYLVNISATNLKPLAEYGAHLMEGGATPFGVITEMTMVKAPKGGYNIIQFLPVEGLTEAQAQAVSDQILSGRPKQIVAPFNPQVQEE